MDEYLFELEYADELDALEDKGELSVRLTPRSRRSLHFATPENKTKKPDLYSTLTSQKPEQTENSFQKEEDSHHTYNMQDAGHSHVFMYSSRDARGKKRTLNDTNTANLQKEFLDSLLNPGHETKRARCTSNRNSGSSGLHPFYSHGPQLEGIPAQKTFEKQESYDHQHRFSDDNAVQCSLDPIQPPICTTCTQWDERDLPVAEEQPIAPSKQASIGMVEVVVEMYEDDEHFVIYREREKKGCRELAQCVTGEIVAVLDRTNSEDLMHACDDPKGVCAINLYGSVRATSLAHLNSHPPGNQGALAFVCYSTLHNAIHVTVVAMYRIMTTIKDLDANSQQQVHTFILQESNFAVTNSEGHRVYIKLQDEHFLEDKMDNADLNGKNSLLSLPVAVLKEVLEQKGDKQAMQEEDIPTSEIYRGLNDSWLVEKSVLEDTADQETEQSHSLWVDRYAPHCYTDLLSEESVNRLLLHWLKKWDYVVFKKDFSAPKISKDKKNKETVNKKYQAEVSQEFDTFKRPIQKIALLCGPPGLGKTTLAHIVARHAGYNVVEMNASDDRSVEAFQNSIQAATQMKAMMGENPRPNCLVIDEIDGASQSAVNVLLGILRQPEASTGRKKKKEDMLLRPVICICNDQYAVALRQLRQQALVIHFPPTEPFRLANKLLDVVRHEQLKVDLTSLLVLCQRMDYDIRSCFNTLQFIRRKHRELTVHMVQTMNVGQKDSHKTIFSVWREVFSMPKPKRNRFVTTPDLAEDNTGNPPLSVISPSARFLYILGLAYAAGEWERLVEGLFENYLQPKSKDPHFVGLTASSEWFCFVDELSWYKLHSQDYSFIKYVPFLAVLVHLLFAVPVPHRISFPHLQHEILGGLTALSARTCAFGSLMKGHLSCREILGGMKDVPTTQVIQNHKRVTGLLTTLLTKMLPNMRKYIDIHTLCLDVLPLFLEIIQPTLRPVNTQLYSTKEKEDLAHVIQVMVHYNLTYRQEHTPEGLYIYVLDPNLEEAVRFSSLKHHKQLTYSARQLIGREIELEKMRRSEVDLMSNIKLAKLPIPSHNQDLVSKSVKEERTQMDYFANLTRTKRQTQKYKAEHVKEGKIRSEKNVLDTLVWFHFKEGYSNAVRRNVHIHDLL